MPLNIIGTQSNIHLFQPNFKLINYIIITATIHQSVDAPSGTVNGITGHFKRGKKIPWVPPKKHH